MTIQEKLQKQLAEKKMSNLESSRLSGVPNSTLADILKGKTSRVSVNAVIAISSALSVSPEYFIHDDITDPDYYSKTDFPISKSERTHIQKYRRLTDNGREAIDRTMDVMLGIEPTTENSN